MIFPAIPIDVLVEARRRIESGREIYSCCAIENSAFDSGMNAGAASTLADEWCNFLEHEVSIMVGSPGTFPLHPLSRLLPPGLRIGGPGLQLRVQLLTYAIKQNSDGFRDFIREWYYVQQTGE